MWKSFLTMGFDMAVFPLLLGMIWCCGKKKYGWSAIYVRGYVTMWMLQWIVIVFAEKRGYTLTDTLELWNYAVMIITAVGVVIIIAFHKSMGREIKILWEHLQCIRQSLRAPICVFVLLVMFVLTVIYPSPEDDVPEAVSIAIQTDTMYAIQPYTRTAYADNSLKLYSPLEIVYALWAKRAGVNSTMMIHMVTPIFLILLFVSVGWMVSSLFYDGDIQKRKLFVLLWMFTYSVAPLCIRHPAVGVLQNPWNGITLLSGTILPLIMYQAILTIKTRQFGIVFFVAAMFAAQMALAKGALLGILMIIACGAAYVIYEGAIRIKNAGNNG